MITCLNPTCTLTVLEGEVCGCGWDNSLATVGAVELEESALLAAEARQIGGPVGAILQQEAAELAVEGLGDTIAGAFLG